MKAKHRFERLVNTLSDVLEQQVESLSFALSDGGEQPPFTRKLTEDEQIEMYVAMDEQKWATMLKEKGAHDTVRYSEAMLRLVDKKYGPIQPSAVWVQATPQDVMNNMAQMGMGGMGGGMGGGMEQGMPGMPGQAPGMPGQPPPGMPPGQPPMMG